MDLTLAEKPTVLVVDDTADNLTLMAALLRDTCRVKVVNHGAKALATAAHAAPDLILLDIMMPEVDGMETMRRMRKLSRGKDLPLIAVTAKAMKGDREKCIDAGAWDYLSKPVDIAHLLVVLRGWLTK
jgi:CheY-like chemotaxis protein